MAITRQMAAGKSKQDNSARRHCKRVYRLNNGMISLKKTPEELVEVSKANSTNSPLLRLPAEIRTQIFHYALMEDRPIYFPSQNNRMSASTNRYNPQAFAPLSANVTIALPSVCRQLYAETSPLFYTLNSFDFSYITINYPFSNNRSDVRKWMYKNIHDWIDARRPFQREAVRSVWIRDCQYEFLFGDGGGGVREVFPGLERLYVEVEVIGARRGGEEEFVERVEGENAGLEISWVDRD